MKKETEYESMARHMFGDNIKKVSDIIKQPKLKVVKK